MPRWQWILGLMVVAEMVWILSSVFRGGEEERRRQRQRPRPPRKEQGPGAPGRPPTTANVDRFLEEINRRRREAMERQAGGTPSRSDPPSFTRTVGPRSPSGTSPRDFSAVEKRSTPSMRARQSASTASAAAVTKKAAEVVIMGEEVFAGREATSRITAATTGEVKVAVPSPSPQMTAPVVSRTDRVSPVLSALSDLMRTRQALQTAIALREIFGPPRCRRAHHQGRGSRATGLQ
jgi:hypothetical protein